MVSMRRIGGEGSTTRAQLLDAALDLMREEGYAAVTSRKLASHAGLKPQLVHYYFRTMDDLFLALFQRVSSSMFEKQGAPAVSDRPLNDLWATSLNAPDAVLIIEFMAVANHRKVLRSAIAEFGQKLRQRQADIITAALEDRGFDFDRWPARVLALAMESMSRSLGFEVMLGMSSGHDETRTAIERLFAELEGAQGEALPVAPRPKDRRK